MFHNATPCLRCLRCLLLETLNGRRKLPDRKLENAGEILDHRQSLCFSRAGVTFGINCRVALSYLESGDITPLLRHTLGNSNASSAPRPARCRARRRIGHNTTESTPESKPGSAALCVSCSARWSEQFAASILQTSVFSKLTPLDTGLGPTPRTFAASTPQVNHGRSRNTACDNAFLAPAPRSVPGPGAATQPSDRRDQARRPKREPKLTLEDLARIASRPVFAPQRGGHIWLVRFHFSAPRIGLYVDLGFSNRAHSACQISRTNPVGPLRFFAIMSSASVGSASSE